MKANLKFFCKNKNHGRFVVELSNHGVPKSKKYSDGIKYGVICMDLKTESFVLMDNHHPKGPHVHVNDQEFSYEDVNDDLLINDFKVLVKKELGVKL